jgi:hypothetical protein
VAFFKEGGNTVEAYLQFYKNKYDYPHYSNTITPYGLVMECTPVGMNFRAGTLRVKGNMSDFMNCNYLAFTRDNITLYAWIEDVRFSTKDSFEVSYQVDPWRTYKNKVDLGTQFVARQPEATVLYDRLLGGSTDYMDITTTELTIGIPTMRTLVVQTRPTADTDSFSRTPVQPSPYQFFFANYEVNNWTANQTLTDLFTALENEAEATNLVTLYSIPYIGLGELAPKTLVLEPSGTEIIGFNFLFPSDEITDFLTLTSPIQWGHEDIDQLLRIDHSVQIVIPEAGIIDVPDNLLVRDDLALRQDIDLFSGASNYMLMTADGQYTQSVRGSSISSIPILSDPLDTYLSQNQNALATSLIGDVASIAVGAGTAYATGGLGTAVGAGLASSGVSNILNRNAQQKDMAHKYSNPPAFLGTALAHAFNGRFWVVTQRTGVENDVDVHTNFGYPVNLVKPLVFPSSGFIQTEGCNVMSTDGSVPRWALNEINNLFNTGILVH